ncbi:hypothetical protein [Mycoplasma suis]|uniref:hypothetical protein n=1 Tax=Mycoplasma suis TaxID=57372 RepID=UPI0011D145AA|nr:hypothetical protein [Mycoplasma suis]
MAVQDKSFNNYFATWNLENDPPELSIWPPLIYTLIVVFISIFLTHFTSIRLAKYVCRMRSEVKKIIILSLKILSVIPSFVTAFVLSEAITPVFFGINGVIAGARVAVLFIILTFFCTALPIFFLNYINWFESSEMKTLNSNLLSLGLNAKWREKLYSKVSRRVIF